MPIQDKNTVLHILYRVMYRGFLALKSTEVMKNFDEKKIHPRPIFRVCTERLQAE